jgi:hypothetical protein
VDQLERLPMKGGMDLITPILGLTGIVSYLAFLVFLVVRMIGT